MSGACCAPGRGEEGPGGPERLPTPVLRREGSALEGLVDIPGGTFRMGSDSPLCNPGDGEGPVRDVIVSPFRISATAVTNAEFARFVAATGHVTGAERWGWSFVFEAFLTRRAARAAERPQATPWWCRIDGADWRHPEGPNSSVKRRQDHPVVHVDHDDARAYAAWAGGRLPTEAEWEYAARGGLDQATYPWGDELTPGGEHRCNIFQGTFPTDNTGEDGWLGTAPVTSYPANGYGLHCVAGNVWEWCADWWGTRHRPEPTSDPTGPRIGTQRVMRGGSYLCHDSYCNRYRVSARTANDPQSTAGNVGFRVAASLPS